jgi:alkylated DNA repair dioxygenase AlkB
MKLFDAPNTMFPFELPNKSEYAARFIESLNGYEITVPNGKLIFIEHFFNPEESKLFLEDLTANQNNLPVDSPSWNAMNEKDLIAVKFNKIQWQQDKIKLFGKSIAIPRFSAWYGDAELAYTYSGLTLYTHPWIKTLLSIKKKIENVSGELFNSVLLNWYRNGSDSMSWHADNEKELGENPIIASVNFGATRKFLLRYNLNTKDKITFHLSNGSLLLMQGALQHFWQHAIPKTKKVHHPRINLTFRRIFNT